MSTDKPVTHADLTMLLNLRDDLLSDHHRAWMDPGSELADLLDRLIAAAEADAPPLPEGWVVERHPDGTSRIVWHKGGVTSMWSDGNYETVTGLGSRLTPLRPTVTESQIKAAAEDCMCEPSAIRQHLAAAGIEVRDVD